MTRVRPVGPVRDTAQSMAASFYPAMVYYDKREALGAW